MEVGCAILGLFSPAVLGSGEGDREWVFAITDVLLGTAIREAVVVVVEALVAKSFCGYTSSIEDELLDGLDRRRSSHRPEMQMQ